jgi:hypothetical protein
MLPRAREGRAERVENRRTLTLIACPTCRESVFFVSMNAAMEVHLECAVCPPAPAVKLTREHLSAARREGVLRP